MAKFYVQSGTLRAVVDSRDAEHAAMWAIHQAMSQIMPLDESDSSREPTSNSDWDDTESNIIDSRRSTPSAGFISLDTSIQLSEIGFDRQDCLQVDTFEAYRGWCSLVQAIDQVANLLDD